MLSRMGKHISKSETGHICVPTSWKEKEVSPWSQFCTLLFAREWVTLGVHNKLDLPKNHVQSYQLLSIKRSPRVHLTIVGKEEAWDVMCSHINYYVRGLQGSISSS